jgi:predicted ArsR family transcriptional regulator
MYAMHLKTERSDLNISERILSYLERNRFGSIVDIAIGAKTSRITARKHLERLARSGLLAERQIGIARVFLF